MEAAFDSLSYFESLKNAGVPEAQARIQAEALRQFEEAQSKKARRELATRADLRELELRLLKWVVGLLFTQTAILLTAIGVAVALLAK